MSKNTNRSSRLPSLDGLRAFSILLVVIGHVGGTVNSPHFLVHFHNLGNFGVKVFFCISGFIITFLMLREYQKNQRVDLKAFYLRRFFRLFPAFYFYVGCIALAASLGFIQLKDWDLLHAVTYTMNYHHVRSWWLNHAWSLAVEEQFYLIWPSIFVLCGIFRAKKALVAAVILCPCIRLLMWTYFDCSPSAMTREFQAVADGLAMGCLLAYLYNGPHKMPNWMRSIAFYFLFFSMFIVPALLMRINPGLFYVIGQSYINLCATLMIWRFLEVREGVVFKLLNSKPAIWLGALSYSLYLWQEPFLNSWTRAWYASFPINIVLAFSAAIFSYYVIEKPGLRLKHHFDVKNKPCRVAS